LNSPEFAEMFDELKKHFDMVLVDSPPILPVTDAVLLSRLTDMTLLIVAAGQTKKGHLRRGFEQLAQVGDRQVGIVLNEVTRQGSDVYDSYSYSYTYVAQNESSAEVSPNGSIDLSQAEENRATERPEAARRGRHARH